MLSHFVSATLLFALVSSHPTSGQELNRRQNNSSNCIEFAVPISVTAPSHEVLIPPFKNGYEATAFALEATKRRAPGDAFSPLGPATNITKTFTIDFTYCAPSSTSAHTKTVQLLTHGIGFDKSYWAFGNASYNYLESATRAGYSVLSYSRLGTGKSQHADPWTETQSPVELAILAQMTTLLRSGSLDEQVPVPEKVVHVGHSYGSLLTNGLVASYPELSDGAVITGMSHNNTWQPWFQIDTVDHLASENQPSRFGDFESGYLIWADKYHNQYAFFKYPFVETSVLEEAEDTKWPFTVGQTLTFGSLTLNAPGFDKPVLVINGDSDLIFCGGNCTDIIDGPYSLTPSVFSAAKPLETYLQPNSGHAMNLHLNATGWYDVVGDFLGRNGL